MDVGTVQLLVIFMTGFVSSSNTKQQTDVHMLSSQMEELKAEFNYQIQNLLKIINDQNQNHAKEMADLQREVHALRRTCTQLKSDTLNDMTSSTVENETLNMNPEENDSETREDERGLSDQREITTTKKTLANQHSIARRVGTSLASNIAFYARLSHDISTLGTDQPIVFDYVVTNLGNHYNPITGLFHCNIPGVYVFHIYILVKPGKVATSLLVKNGDTIAFLFSGESEGTYDLGGHTAVVELQSGDSVWAKYYAPGSSKGDVIDPNYSSISGYLLYPL